MIAYVIFINHVTFSADVWLDYFRDHQSDVLAMRSGDELKYHDGYLDSMQGKPIASLSKGKREELDELAKKGYAVTYAEVSYVLAWRPRDEKEEVAVCLANLQLERILPLIHKD